MLDELEELREGIAPVICGRGTTCEWVGHCFDERPHWSLCPDTEKADQILSYLAKQGVMIQTPQGIMMLSDLLKKEDKCQKS